MTTINTSDNARLQLLVLDRVDEACNMARFYVLSIEPTLLGDVSLVREWGRLGTEGRRIIELHDSQEAAAEALEAWLERKLRKGYAVRSFPSGHTPQL